MTDHAPLLERAFAFVPEEADYEIERVEGRLPSFLRGTYYLNGPARFHRGGLKYRHWLDGDGMVCAIRFSGGGGVRFTSRYVRTAKLAFEDEAGGFAFRAFGTSFPSDRLKRRIAIESPVNVSTYPYAGKLLAFGEQGLPVALDPATLATLGEFNFGGALNDISPFAAHPKFDAETGELFNFGVAYSPTEPQLNFYRFDREAKLLFRRRHTLDYSCTLHDFGLSASYAVFYLSPYILDMKALALEGRTIMESLSWEPERGSSLLVVSRETGERVAQVSLGVGYCLHLINCFEQGDLLNVDLLELERPVYDQYQVLPDLFTEVCRGRPVRYSIGMPDGEPRARREIAYDLAPDFPSIDPRLSANPYGDFWMLGISATGRSGRKFFDELVHAEWGERVARDVFRAPAFQYLGGEPIFIPDEGDEQAGVVICQLFDAREDESSFLVFDAFDVASGPVARLRLHSPVHLGFHASFLPDARSPKTKGA